MKKSSRPASRVALLKNRQCCCNSFEHINEGFAYCRVVREGGQPKDFVFLSVDPRFSELTGLKAVAGKGAAEVFPGIHESDPELFEVCCRVVATGNPEKFELFVEVLQTWVDLSIFRTEQDCFVILSHVITERQVAEQKLLDNEERYRRLFELESDALMLVDCATHRFVDVNHSAQQLYGYSRQELIQMKVEEISTEPEKTRETVETGNIHVPLRWHRKKDGTVFPVEISGSLIEYQGRQIHLAAIRDITGRRRLEEQMSLLFSALTATANAIVITDCNGQIEWVNPAFTLLTGYSSGEAAGNNPRVLKSGRQPPEFYADMWQTILAGKVWRGEVVNKRKDGRFYTEEMTITPVLGGKNRIAHFVAIKQDVTERRQLEEQFRQAQKMDAIGQLASGVAHDFNNILTVIQFQTGLLKAEYNRSTKPWTFADEIEKSVQLAASLTRQLLLVSRKQPQELRDLDLNDIVTGITKMLRRILSEDIRMELRFSSQPLMVHADAGMIDQILLNLAVNARDAMPSGGTVTIETTFMELDEVSAKGIARGRPGSYACLNVSDTGCGISSENLDRIFEPFFTTKEPGKGTGLGLATVWQIVQQHHGWMNVYSQVKQGTTFRIYLPIRFTAASRKSA